MTQGRFDTVHNCRPPGWDSRHHWTNMKRHPACSRDHMERESCPFHDVRAGGQFQYEYWGSGVGGTLIEPTTLTKRSDAKHMIHGIASGEGTGGGGIPCDDEAGRPQVSLKRVVDGRPWSHVTRLRNGLFSAPEYIPEGPRTKSAQVKGLPLKPQRAFSSGSKSAPYLNKPIEHVADQYDGKIDMGRTFHFKAGVPKDLEDSRKLYHISAPPTPPRRRQEGPFYAGRHPMDSFGGPLKVEPEPYDFGKIKNEKRPIFTWYTHSKWSMPVDAPWATGKTTAEPKKGDSLGTTLADVPAVGNFSLSQTIGREAALIAKPGAVEFRR